MNERNGARAHLRDLKLIVVVLTGQSGPLQNHC